MFLFRKRLLVIILFLISLNLFSEDFFKVKERIIKESWKKISFIYLYPKLSITNLGYSDNIYLMREDSKPDWTADLGLQMTLSSIFLNRFIFQINEFPYYSFYAKNKNERSFNNAFGFNLYSYIGIFNLKYQFEKQYVRQRPTEEFGRRVRQNLINHTLSLDFGNHNSLFLSLYLNQKSIKYSEELYIDEYDLSNLLNHKEYWSGIGLNKIIFSRTLLSLNFGYFEQNFDYSKERNRIGKQISIGIQFPEISSIKGSFQYGVRIYEPSNPLYEDFTKPFGSGDISIKLFRRLKLNFNYIIDNIFSYWQMNSTYNQKSIGTSIEYYLSRKLKLGYRYRDNKLSFTDSYEGLEIREDRFYTNSIYIGIKLFKKMGIGIEYSRYRGNSTEPGFKRSYNFIGGYIIHEF